CTTALWPIDTFSPITVGCPLSTCTETLSCTLLPAPSVMDAESARRTALYQTLDSAASVTSPMRRAPSATKLSSAICGVLSGRARTDAVDEMLMRRDYP